MKKLYTLNPLNWKDYTIDGVTSASARVPMGIYFVSIHHDKMKWGYCFDEYHDEDSFECGTLEEGKELAWKEWQKRIGEALTEHKL